MSRIQSQRIQEALQVLYLDEHALAPDDFLVQEHIPTQVTFQVRANGEWFDIRIPEEVLQNSPMNYVIAAYLRKAMRRLPPPRSQ